MEQAANRSETPAAYSTMMADPAAVQGRKLEFYDDRIESVSARGTSVIPFADVTAYIETMRVIALVSRRPLHLHPRAGSHGL